jgi:SAM-dependent methyltransferase
MSICAIDFAERYREHLRRQNRPAKPPGHWDARASSMSEGVFETEYVHRFVERMNLEGCATLLDVGCGPGTIALSVARRLDHVYGLDYSPGMLAAFVEHARARGLTAVTPILLGWEDDWAAVPVCDVVVASRSTAVPDLEAAVLKLQSKARVRVYLTYPADGHFVPAGVRRAIGREGFVVPDYLCVVGVLHQLGLRPTLDYLPGENRFANCPDYESLEKKVSQTVGPLSPDETNRLRTYFDTNREDLVRTSPARWALFSWETSERTDDE